jgi:hypothetical protein
MSNISTEDEQLWEQSHTAIQHEIKEWSFSSNYFIIGDNRYHIIDYLTLLVLGLFDIHFTYWMSMTSQLNYSHNYFYHTRLRSAVENHFKDSVGDSLSLPPILLPWLWRTFCLCPHTPMGRQMFQKLATKYNITVDDSSKAPTFSGSPCFLYSHISLEIFVFFI